MCVSLSGSMRSSDLSLPTKDAVIAVIDDDEAVRDSLGALLEAAGYRVQSFDAARKYLDAQATGRVGCLVVDIRMPDMDGLALQEELVRRRATVPVIVVTGHGDVPLAVRAMKAGAVDFLEKPFSDDVILAAVEKALKLGQPDAGAIEASERVALLTPRERQVLEQLVVGNPNKVIAFELGISPRTVEIHRAHLMEKMRAKSLSDLVRQALAAGIRVPD